MVLRSIEAPSVQWDLQDQSLSLEVLTILGCSNYSQTHPFWGDLMVIL